MLFICYKYIIASFEFLNTMIMKKNIKLFAYAATCITTAFTTSCARNITGNEVMKRFDGNNPRTSPKEEKNIFSQDYVKKAKLFFRNNCTYYNSTEEINSKRINSEEKTEIVSQKFLKFEEKFSKCCDDLLEFIKYFAKHEPGEFINIKGSMVKKIDDILEKITTIDEINAIIKQTRPELNMLQSKKLHQNQISKALTL